MDDLISRQASIDALWKALYEYEDETEKQFQESEDLDVGDWIGHRIFVQNMSDIDRQTILNLPSAQPEQRWIPCSERLPEERGFYLTTTKDKAVYCDYWNEDNFDRTEMVIAWMPIDTPEPYKEDDHETD